MTECRHGIETDWCAECTPRQTQPSNDPGTMFTASFDSECTNCFRDILAGDDVMARDGEYLCRWCTPDPGPDLGGPFS